MALIKVSELNGTNSVNVDDLLLVSTTSGSGYTSNHISIGDLVSSQPFLNLNGSSGTSGTSGIDGTSFTWRGEWDSITQYQINDVVSFGGSSYIAIMDVSGYQPYYNQMWSPLVMAGTSGTSGTSGESGTNGTSGIDGTSGTSGESGTSGTSGFDGTSGTSGTSGTDGSSGTSGSDGTSVRIVGSIAGENVALELETYFPTPNIGDGVINETDGHLWVYNGSGWSDVGLIKGPSGSSGTSGTSGIDGTSGTSGIDGTSGTSGESGTSGTSGFDGTSGTSGESGSSGTSGTSGRDGVGGEVRSFTNSTTWNVNHNLDTEHPIVTVWDNNNKVIVPGQITSVDSNNLTVTFSVPTSGYVNVVKGGDVITGSTAIAGTSGSSGTSGTSAPIGPGPTVYGLFAQTGSSITVSGTTVESTLVGGGTGTLSVPANGFQVGDSFMGRMVGHISSKNNVTIRIRIKTGSVILGDTGLLTIPQTTNKHYTIDLNFTIRTLGAATVASVVSGIVFTYSKDASNAFEGSDFSVVNNTTFDTTIDNTLNLTVEWGTTNTENAIYSEYFVLNKVY